MNVRRVSYLSALALVTALAANTYADTMTFQRGASPSEDYTGSISNWIQSNNPGQSKANELFFGTGGGANPNIVRGLLSFDLSALPADAVISAASVTLTIAGALPTGDAVGDVQIDMMAMTAAFSSNAKWNDSGTNYDSTPLSSVTADPMGVTTGEQLVFSSTESFTAFVQQALLSGSQTLYLMFKLPDDIERTDGTTPRRTFRFQPSNGGDVANRPSLTIEYSVPVPEPATVALGFGGVALAAVALSRRKRSRKA